MEMLRKAREVLFARGLLISLGIHGLVVAALFLDIPWPERLQEPEPDVVEVTLVPPPPEPQPEPEPEPEEQAPEEEPIPEPPAGEELPQPPAEEPEASEPAPEPAPEPVQPEAAEAEPEPQEPSPEEQQAPQPEADPAEAGAGETVPIPTLRPVFEFGEEDRGPDRTPDGGRVSSEDEPETDQADTGAAQAPPESDVPVSEETAEATQAPAVEDTETRPETADAQIETEPLENQEPGLNLPELALPEASLAPDSGEADGSAVAGLPVDDAAPAEALPQPGEDLQADTAEPPESDAAAAADSQASGDPAPVELAEADRRFSPDLTQDRAAMAAMGDLPRELRASQLCTTELREQLRYGTPAYRPEMLPAYRLDAGNVLAVPEAAFRADGVWYDLSFRCTVDDGALRVTGFALAVGDPIPREDWAARGFPEF